MAAHSNPAREAISKFAWDPALSVLPMHGAKKEIGRGLAERVK
jgi:hypothetical protein